MATSGSYDFTLNRDAIITLAFQLINVYSLDETVSNNDITFATKILNGITKLWQTEGIKLWKRRIGYVFTAYNDYNYEVGSPSGANHCTNSYISTTISADEALGQTVLSLTSTTGMTASDFIGIELDDSTRQWTTIVSVDSSTQVTVTASLTAAAASGNTVITYTSKLNRPLKILRATILDLNTLTETQMMPLSYDDYFNMPLKTTAGTPNNYYYDKLITNAIPHTGTLYLFPRPNNVDKIVSFSYLDSIQDFDSSTDNADFPQEWLYPLAYNLAVELCPIYGKLQELPVLQPKADAFKAMINNFDSDNEDLNICTSTRKYK